MRFPNNTHTKVVVKESATIQETFLKPLEKRGFAFSEVVLQDGERGWKLTTNTF